MSELTIDYDYFQKLDIRICTVKGAQKIEGTTKLIKLEVDCGAESRTLVAGIAESYNPEELIDKQIPVLMNLEKREIRGIESNGMILAADDSGIPVLFIPEKKVDSGTKVR